MRNNYPSLLRIVLIGLLAFAAPAKAADSTLTVTGIVIDKTDKNAVVARDQAIIEAQRTAFEELARKSMSPEEFKSFKMPDDKTIAALVQDFEIKSEQISANRYVAIFTVRFGPDIVNYINIPTGQTTFAAEKPPAPPTSPAATETAFPVVSKPRDVLVLPYFKTISGKIILWGDPNPWRDTWQALGSSKPAENLTITVPTGDLTDLSVGNAEAVWSGDHSAVEKLQAIYNANEVALAVANQSGPQVTVDLYLYRNGKLERQKTLIPYSTETDALKQAVSAVTAAIQNPQPYADETAATSADPAPVIEAPAAEKVTLEATMAFGTFTQWLEVQKRLAAISPPPSIEISSLTKNSARFSIAYDGGLETLKTALAEKGLALNQPVIEVDESLQGSGVPTQRSIYELSLLN